MKISPKDLPAHIAKALKPRTFAQELPKYGQSIEALCKTYGWSRGVFDPDDRFIENANGFMELTDSVLWRPVLEIEDEAPEPERELPMPESYFILNGQLASCCHNSRWYLCADESGKSVPGKTQDITRLPDNWQPLSDLIAKAARVEELEAEAAVHVRHLHKQNVAARQKQEEIEGLKRQVEYWENLHEEAEARIKQQDAELAELKRQADYWEGHADSMEDDATSSAHVINRLSKTIKKQDEILDLLDSGKIGNFQVVAKMLEARRKAREASE